MKTENPHITQGASHAAPGQAMSEPKVTLVLFRHANFNTPIYVIKQLITGFYRSEASKATYLVTTSNTIFPVLESVEEVTRKLNYPIEGVNPNV